MLSPDKKYVLDRALGKSSATPFTLARHCHTDMIEDANGNWLGFLSFNGNAKQRRQQKRAVLRYVNRRVERC
ncbi:hypothetical protein FQZ97_605100 [compost metagenome]